MVDSNDGDDDTDDGSVEEQILASVEAMLHSLIDCMAKCEPEDFELVCSFLWLQMSQLIFVVISLFCVIQIKSQMSFLHMFACSFLFFRSRFFKFCFTCCLLVF